MMKRGLSSFIERPYGIKESYETAINNQVCQCSLGEIQPTGSDVSTFIAYRLHKYLFSEE